MNPRAALFVFALLVCVAIVAVGTMLDRATTRAFDEVSNLAQWRGR